ncbi:MAG: tetratricopeptide repeat protein [Promethearchaeota archaeon]
MCKNSECNKSFVSDYIESTFYGLDINRLPSIIAIPLKDYVDEPNPILRLHRLCDAIELITRFFTILGFAELMSNKKYESSLRKVLTEFRWRISKPTLAKWREMLTSVFNALEKFDGLKEFIPFISNFLIPLIGTLHQDVSKKILPLRNLLVHGGALKKSTAYDILSDFEPKLINVKDQKPKIVEFWQELKILEDIVLIFVGDEKFGEMKGVELSLKDYKPTLKLEELFKNNKGHIYFLYKEKSLDLWPICIYQKAKSFSIEEQVEELIESPMIYFRFEITRILYATLGVDLCMMEDTSEESLEKFKRIFKLEEEEDLRKVSFLDFEKEILQDTEIISGRKEQIQDVKDKINEARNADQKIKKNHVLWITGPPGIGKSMIMSKVAKDLLGDPDHQCRIMYRFNTSDPRCNREKFFKYSIAKMLENLKIDAPSESDPFKLEQTFDRLLDIFTKFKRSRPDKRPKQLLIFLDGLDEIYQIDPEFIKIPFKKSFENVFWICAGRPESPLLEQFKEDVCIHVFEGEGLECMSDNEIRGLLIRDTGKLKYDLIKRDEEFKDEKVINKFIETVVKRSKGLPLYIHYIIQDILRGELTFEDEMKLPMGLTKYYDNLLEHLKIGPLHNILTPLIFIIAWAEEPLSEETIQYFLVRWKVLRDTKESRKLLRKGIQFVQNVLKRIVSSDGTLFYRIYHESFREHIHNSLEFKELNKIVQERFYKASKYWKDLPEGPTQSYIMQYSAYHLLTAKEYYGKDNEELKFKNREEESLIVSNATEGLVSLFKESELEFSRHINEVLPICNLLDKLEEYELMVKFIDIIKALLEVQAKWVELKALFELGTKSIKFLKPSDILQRINLAFQFGLSRAIYHMGRYKESIENAKSALEIATILKERKIQGEIIWHIGAMYRFTGETNAALNYYSQAEEISTELNDQVNLARCKFGRGVILHGQGKFEEAREFYDKALEIADDKDKRKEMGERLFDILRIRGDLGYQLKNYKLAEESWELMKKYAEDLLSDHSLISAKARLSLLQEIYGNINYEQMKKLWDDHLREDQISQERASEITSYGESAEVYIRTGEISEIIALCEKAEEIFQELGEFNNLHTRSGINYTRGIKAIANANIIEAEKLLNKSEELFGKWTSPFRYWVKDTLNRLKKWIDKTE